MESRRRVGNVLEMNYAMYCKMYVLYVMYCKILIFGPRLLDVITNVNLISGKTLKV